MVYPLSSIVCISMGSAVCGYTFENFGVTRAQRRAPPRRGTLLLSPVCAVVPPLGDARRPRRGEHHAASLRRVAGAYVFMSSGLRTMVACSTPSSFHFHRLPFTYLSKDSRLRDTFHCRAATLSSGAVGGRLRRAKHAARHSRAVRGQTSLGTGAETRRKTAASRRTAAKAPRVAWPGK